MHRTPVIRRDFSSARTNSPTQSLDSALERIFPTSQEESKLEKTRRIMGDAVESLTDEELQIYITKFQQLVDYCLDMFERQSFDGATLREILQEE